MMMTQTHLDSDATVLHAGVLKVRSRLLAVSVFYASSRPSSLTLLPLLPVRLIRLQLIVVLILYVLFSFENSRSSVIARS